MPELNSMEAVAMTASRFPRQKNATKKRGTLSMSKNHPEFHPVPYSSRTAMPFEPPGAKWLGVTNIKMPNARTMPEMSTGSTSVRIHPPNFFQKSFVVCFMIYPYRTAQKARLHVLGAPFPLF